MQTFPPLEPAESCLLDAGDGQRICWEEKAARDRCAQEDAVIATRRWVILDSTAVAPTTI
jgi:hypothetical protein